MDGGEVGQQGQEGDQFGMRGDAQRSQGHGEVLHGSYGAGGTDGNDGAAGLPGAALPSCHGKPPTPAVPHPAARPVRG
ncbi:hypothetical protein GCM10009757_27750 [Streptomyces cheonanensis]|uniref:Uncharacterized protein n=1 Tax=Streptomyces cheonanensis TaxID=312720 RepID=A0ABP5GSX3_9ACTN